MRTVLLGGIIAILVFASAFAGFYWWQYGALPLSPQPPASMAPSEIDSSSATTLQVEEATPPPQITQAESEVLGASREYIFPSTLYGLINGLRRSANVSPLSINPVLEATAQRLVRTSESEITDPLELAKSQGFGGKTLVTLLVDGQQSAWDVFTQLQNQERANLMIQSSSFSEIGGAILCDETEEPPCTAYILLGSR